MSYHQLAHRSGRNIVDIAYYRIAGDGLPLGNVSLMVIPMSERARRECSQRYKECARWRDQQRASRKHCARLQPTSAYGPKDPYIAVFYSFEKTCRPVRRGTMFRFGKSAAGEREAVRELVCTVEQVIGGLRPEARGNKHTRRVSITSKCQ